ncbi:MAG: pilus assembly protein PilM [Porcipelethomonas sp.]
MLSFDITDNSIKIVKGYESGGKIRINAAAALEIENDIIVNGHIKDVPKLAGMLSEVIKNNGMKEREAIVSISSDLTIFKELHIPKAKGQQFLKMVKTEMQTTLGVDDSYSYSYVIVGEDIEKDEKGVVVEKVLATACPYEVVESYKKLFSAMNLSLKSVMVGCNSISKVILSDVKTRIRMPLLTVQVDKHFLSTNIYDDGKLVFSRFVTIDPNDYAYAQNYVIDAVNENIFRMVQFQKTRNSSSPIENVMFYGDLSEYEKLKVEVESQDLNVSVISVPPQISGCEKLDFSAYANAIGAMFKRNKNTEKVNLLETDSANKNAVKSDSSFTILLLGTLLGSAALIGGIWFALQMRCNSIETKTNELRAKINSAATIEQQQEYAELVKKEASINNYRNAIEKALNAFRTHPQVSSEYIDIIDTAFTEASNELGLWADVSMFSYSNYSFSISLIVGADSDPSQTLPALIVEKLSACDKFTDVSYSGYTISSAEDMGQKSVQYEISIVLNELELPTEAETEGAVQ